MREVNVTMQPYEYRMRWYGEDEATAKVHAGGLSVGGVTPIGTERHGKLAGV